MNTPSARKPDAQAKPCTAVAASPSEPVTKRLLQPDGAPRARFYQVALAGAKETK